MTSHPRHSDVLIVGGGLFGCFTGLFLANAGLKVTLLEKGQIGAKASATNFGALRLHGRSAVQYPLSLQAQELWEDYKALTSEDCEIQKTGHLYIARTKEGAQRLESEAALAESFGVESQLIPGEKLHDQFPYFSERIIMGSYSPRSSVANPRLATPPLARSIVRSGGTIIENCPVVDIQQNETGFTVTTNDKGQFDAPKLVNAAGAWAGNFAQLFDETVPMFKAGPPQFVTEPVSHVLMPSMHMVEGDVIVRQIPRGNIIFSGFPRTHSNTDGRFTYVPPAKTRNGMQSLVAAIPMLSQVNIIRVWSGVEGYLPDMLPVIGQSETTKGLYHAFGGSGGGFQIAPAVGSALATLILSGSEANDILMPFAINRFSKSHIVSEKISKEFDTPEL